MENETIISVEEALLYLGIDYADEMVTYNVSRMIKTAQQFLYGSIGYNLPVDDPRVKELCLIVVNDLYNNRDYMGSKSLNNVRRLVDDLSMQLRLEMRKDND